MRNGTERLIMTVPRNPIVAAMRARMAAVFDGGWTTHSIDMVDEFFRSAGTTDASGIHAPLPAGTVVLDFPALFPFGWTRGDIYTSASSLFNGKSYDFDGSGDESARNSGRTYSIHLFHSQSEGVTRYFEPQQLRPPAATNFARAVRLALDPESFAGLLAKLATLPYYSDVTKKALAALAAENGVNADGSSSRS